MRKISIVLTILAAAVIFSGCGADTSGAEKAEYRLIRIHIRADSNAPEAQAVKLLVRDAVTEYLTRELGEVSDFDAAYRALSKRLESVETLARRTLEVNGYFYGATVRLNHEFFPARAYEGVVVESGYYDALIIELGSGQGDNWWCVIYPPLCYISTAPGEDGFRYRSKIKELWDAFTGKSA